MKPRFYELSKGLLCLLVWQAFWPLRINAEHFRTAQVYHSRDEVQPRFIRICPVDQIQMPYDYWYPGRGWFMNYGTGRADLSASGIPYSLFIHACPVCHFSGNDEDFIRPVSQEVKDFVAQNLKPFHQGEQLDPVTESDLAIKLYVFEKRSPFEIAQLALNASYLLYDEIAAQQPVTGFTFAIPNQRRKFQIQAAYYFELAWNQNQVPENERMKTAYLLGEMYRRLGEFNRALHWFDTAKSFEGKTGDFWERVLGRLLLEQRPLAVRGDANDWI